MQRLFDLLTPRNLGLLLLAGLPPAVLHFFYNLYNLNIPRIDAAQRSTLIAVRFADGTLTPPDLFQSYFGQITIVRHTLTLAMTALTDWNHALETYSNLWLAVLVYLLLLSLIYHIDPRLVWALMVPISVLTFSLEQNQLWLIGYDAAWLDVELFFLIALNLLFCFPKRIWALVLAGAALLVATFAHGHGFMGWWLALPLVALNQAGRARVGFGLGWGVLALANTAAYYLLTVNFTYTGSFGTEIIPPGPLGMVHGTLVFVGNSFASFDVPLATVVGAVGVSLFVVNIVILLRLQTDLRVIAIILAMAGYGLGVGALVSLTRLNLPYGGNEAGLANFFHSYYHTPAKVFWIALLVAAGLLVLRWEYTTPRRLLFSAQIVIAAGFTYSLIPATYDTLRDEQFMFTGQPACYVDFLLLQDESRVITERGCDMWLSSVANDVAYHGLAMFADYPRAHIIGPTYDPSQVVILENDFGWGNFHIHKWFLADVPAENVYHVFPETYPGAAYAGTPLPVEPATPAIAELTVYDTIWHVSRTDIDPLIGFHAQLTDANYIAAQFREDIPDSNIKYNITRYDRVQVAPLEPIPFGDALQLTGVSSLDGRVVACATLPVQTRWTTDDNLPADYSATLTLDRVTGDGLWDFDTVARQDQGLTAIPTSQWTPDDTHLDVRSLDVPCDLPPGDYVLQIGVYNYLDGQRLSPGAGPLGTPPEGLGLVRFAQFSLP